MVVAIKALIQSLTKFNALAVTKLNMDQCLSEPERSNDSEEVLEEVDSVEVSTWTQLHAWIGISRLTNRI